MIHIVHNMSFNFIQSTISKSNIFTYPPPNVHNYYGKNNYV